MAWFNRTALDLDRLIEKVQAHLWEVWQRLSYDDDRKQNHIASFHSDWDEAPMKEAGFVSDAFMPAEVAVREPFDDWKGLIGILANHVAATRAATRLSKTLRHVAPGL